MGFGVVGGDVCSIPNCSVVIDGDVIGIPDSFGVTGRDVFIASVGALVSGCVELKLAGTIVCVIVY